jgi:hypothetical protein
MNLSTVSADTEKLGENAIRRLAFADAGLATAVILQKVTLNVF